MSNEKIDKKIKAIQKEMTKKTDKLNKNTKTKEYVERVKLLYKHTQNKNIKELLDGAYDDARINGARSANDEKKKTEYNRKAKTLSIMANTLKVQIEATEKNKKYKKAIKQRKKMNAKIDKHNNYATKQSIEIKKLIATKEKKKEKEKKEEE